MDWINTIDNGLVGRRILFVISSVSGGGKTTVINRLMECLPGLRVSLSHTTRKPRPDEREGEDYFFVSRGEFAKMIEKEQFLEWAEVYGHLYGTSKAAVDASVSGEDDVILDIDVQGALHVREKRPDAVLVFLVPPSMEEQGKRLERRGTEDPNQLLKRLEAAREELATLFEYDYAVLNDEVGEAVKAVKSIILSERCRTGRILP